MANNPSRREVIAGAGASALALSGAGFAQPQTVARGVVFEDGRGDGRRQAGDPGIPGVMVSNGRDVVLTAQDGSWSLPVEPGDSIFVIKPPHWGTPASAGGIPSFSYIHQPEGSPKHLGTHFPVIDPTGPLPASLDFPLIRHEEHRDFEALLVSDTQPENAAELDYVRDDIIAAMLGAGAAFGINHGDVVADDLSLYPRYLQMLGSTGIPWHHCPGNHDLNHAAQGDRASRETWKRVFGARHYAFQHADATFFILDNVEYFGRASGRYRGLLGLRQLDFVRNVLRHVPPERLVVLSMHIPLRCHLDPDNPADTTADYRDLLALLSGRPNTVSFAGHLHATEHHYLHEAEGFAGPRPHHHHVLTAASGSWWSGPSDHRGIPCADSSDGTPNGFHVLSVSGNRYTTRFAPAVTKAASQLRVLIDGPHCRLGNAAKAEPHRPGKLGLCVPINALGQCHVVANVFDGGPKTTVTYEIVGHCRQMPMHAASMPDPLIVELFARDAPRKAWVGAVASSHIWKAALPATLPPGAHALLVHAWDEYGREHIARAVLEVTAAL
jgi:C terminal of Calcineurin-like phosphoesterase/Calcineurin-like phosphoesterase